MALIDKSIYPILPKNLPEKIIKKHYTLNSEEMEFTVNKTINSKNQIYFAILFKTYQKLGYFIPIHKCPENIIVYIAKCLMVEKPTEYELFCYDKIRTKDRHIVFIREFFKIKLTKNSIILNIANNIAKTKSSLIDIINGTIEELLANFYELPKFNLLEVICTKARNAINNDHYDLIYSKITKKQEKYIKNNVLIYGSGGKSKWFMLKQEPPQVSINNIKKFSAHLEWLKKTEIFNEIFSDIPQVKLDSLYEEGYAYNFYEIKRLRHNKKIATITLVAHMQLLQAIDDLIYMLIEHVNDMENAAKQDLLDYKINKLEYAEYLVNKFKKILTELKEGKTTTRLTDMSQKEVEELIKMCDEYNAYSKYKHLHFLHKRLARHHNTILFCLGSFNIEQSSPAKDTIKMIKYLSRLNESNKNIDIKKEKFNLS